MEAIGKKGGGRGDGDEKWKGEDTSSPMEAIGEGEAWMARGYE